MSAPGRGNFERCFFVVALALNLFVAAYGIRDPLTDYHSFRETQTAISTYWIIENSQWLKIFKYQTPVFGYPWRVPFEFPIYQWIVAVAYQATHISLDTLGRGISVLFFYACLWPIYMLARGLGMDRRLFYLAGALVMLSPVYLYWSRSFMIESTALFFCFLYLAQVQKFLSAGRYRILVWLGFTLAGIVGILVKVTTFPPFALAGAVLVLADMSSSGNFRNTRRWMRTYLPVVLGMALMAICIEVWIRASDAIKATNELTRMFTSGALTSWNWGTWAQRTSQALWLDAIWTRGIMHSVGSPFILGILMVAFFVAPRRSKQIIALLVVMFFTEFLIFTNLYIVHVYYLYATSIFLVLAVAVGFWELRSFSRSAYLAACVTAALMEIAVFGIAYGRYLRQHPADDGQIQAAYFVNQMTPRESVILLIGCNWSPVVPYYARRRAISLAEGLSAQQVRDIFDQPNRFTKGRPVSAIVDKLDGEPIPQPDLVASYVDRMRPTSRVFQFGNYRVMLRSAGVPVQSNYPEGKHIVLNRHLDEQMRGFVTAAPGLSGLANNQ